MMLPCPLAKSSTPNSSTNAGGIEADVTVTRLSETAYVVVTPAATVQRELSWMRKYQHRFNVVVMDVTAGEGVLALMGPNRAQGAGERFLPTTGQTKTTHLVRLTPLNLAWVSPAPIASPMSRELGWELYVSSDMAAHAFETLIEAGADHDLKLLWHAYDGFICGSKRRSATLVTTYRRGPCS